jgi:hypothetical protein
VNKHKPWSSRYQRRADRVYPCLGVLVLASFCSPRPSPDSQKSGYALPGSDLDAALSAAVESVELEESAIEMGPYATRACRAWRVWSPLSFRGSCRCVLWLALGLPTPVRIFFLRGCWASLRGVSDGRRGGVDSRGAGHPCGAPPVARCWTKAVTSRRMPQRRIEPDCGIHQVGLCAYLPSTGHRSLPLVAHAITVTRTPRERSVPVIDTPCY